MVDANNASETLGRLGLSKLPHYEFGMSQAWILSVMLAHKLVVYTGLIDSTAGHGHEHRWWGWESKTIRVRIISIDAVITRQARWLILREDRAAPWQSLLRVVLRHQQHRAPS